MAKRAAIYSRYSSAAQTSEAGSTAVYVLEFPGGKVYVGVSDRLRRRMTEHRYAATSGRNHPLCKAIRKHGFPAPIVVAERLSRLVAAEIEKGLIADLNAHAHASGYNASAGGDQDVVAANYEAWRRRMKDPDVMADYRQRMSVAQQKARPRRQLDLTSPQQVRAWLLESLSYDPDTGDFTRLNGTGGEPAGAVAGSVGPNGYRLISVGYGRYYAHRLVWLFVHGRWPIGELRFRNGIRTDTRLANLNEVPPQLTAEQQREICARYAKGGISQTELGKLFGVSQHAVSRAVIRGKQA